MRRGFCVVNGVKFGCHGGDREVVQLIVLIADSNPFESNNLRVRIKGLSASY